MNDNEKVRKSESDFERSLIMSKVHAKDTKPEMIVRRLVYSLGYRYRLHRKDLPGKPDMVFFRRKKLIFIHGCFWHRHNCKAGLKKPKSNQEYWIPKLARNAQRDKVHQEQLINLGWKILIIWECELKFKDKEHLIEKIKTFLDS